MPSREARKQGVRSALLEHLGTRLHAQLFRVTVNPLPLGVQTRYEELARRAGAGKKRRCYLDKLVWQQASLHQIRIDKFVLHVCLYKRTHTHTPPVRISPRSRLMYLYLAQIEGFPDVWRPEDPAQLRCHRRCSCFCIRTFPEIFSCKFVNS